MVVLLIGGGVSSTFAQTEWQKYQNNPVIVKDTTQAGTWEWAAIGQPSCLYENDTFKMWFAAVGVSAIGDTVLRGRINYAYSIDGIHWTKHGSPSPVLDIGKPGEWDARWVDTPAVVRDSTGYKLYYYGDTLFQPHSAIGLATSPDGIDWQRYENNPILGKGDSLLDWDGYWIESPAVLYDAEADTYRMWFTGVGYGTGFPSDLCARIGYAFSPDGKTWTKDSINNPVFDTGEPGAWDDAWVATPAVRKRGAVYEMWYCGISRADWARDNKIDTIRIGYATSVDAIHWLRYENNPVLSYYDPPADSGGPWAPDVVFDGSQYTMFYEAAAPSPPGGNWICMARGPLAGVNETKNLQATNRMQISPNPFSQEARITVLLPDPTFPFLKIYDPTGRVVKSFPLSIAARAACDKPTEPNQSPSIHMKWDGRDDTGSRLPAGVYFCQLTAKEKTITRKIIIIGK